MRDEQRIDRNRRLLVENHFDALVCALPSNVLLLSGYWPVVGTSIAVFTPERIVLIVPEDEKEIADGGWADDVRTFESGTLDRIQTLTEAVKPLLHEVLRSINLGRRRIGYEARDWMQPASYAATHVYGASMYTMISQAMPDLRAESAKTLLDELRVIKTQAEIAKIRHACQIAGRAFETGVADVRAGRKETEVAAGFRAALMEPGDDERADGFTYCMSGPNAAQAYAAYQRSRFRSLREGELVLVHCNSYLSGWWTDITRTYCVGEPSERQRKMYEAVFDARCAALEAVRPGGRAADVDLAARRVIERHGFGPQFRHPTGHGAGYAAIDHNAKPRLHPQSPDVLEVGMVFNVEPGIYFDNDCGMRHCDMVALTDEGAEVLTPFQDPSGLVIQQ